MADNKAEIGNGVIRANDHAVHANILFAYQSSSDDAELQELLLWLQASDRTHMEIARFTGEQMDRKVKRLFLEGVTTVDEMKRRIFKSRAMN